MSLLSPDGLISVLCILDLRRKILEYGKVRKNKNPVMRDEACSHPLCVNFCGFLKFGRLFLKFVSEFPELECRGERKVNKSDPYFG